MTTRIIVTLEMPDVELAVEDALPDWDGPDDPTAADVLAEMKRSVHIHRMLGEWGLDGVHKVHIQVNTSNDSNRRIEHTDATWDENIREDAIA